MSKKAVISTIILFLLTIIYFVAIHRHLYGDGSYYLLKILAQEDFFIPHKARFFASVTKEFLPVILIKSGITDISLLSYSYGLNHFLIPLLAFGLSYWVCPAKEKTYLMIIVFSSYTFLFCNTSMNITSETQVAGAIFWPTFLSVFNRSKYILSIIGIIVLWFSYEGSFVLLSVILAAVFLEKNKSHRNYVLMSLCVIGIALTLYFTLFPHDEAHTDNRYYSITRFIYLFYHVPFWLSLVLILSPLLLFLRQEWIKEDHLFLVCVLSAILYIFWPFLFKGSINPSFHYFGRILNVLVPAILGAIILLNKRLQFINDGRTLAPKFFVTIIVTSVFSQLSYSVCWQQFLNHFRESLNTSHGIIKYQDSIMSQSGKSMVFHKDWTTPTMSVLIQAIDGRVIETIIKNEKSDIWQPWNPDNERSWPKLNHLGIKYEVKSEPSKY